ncbi:MAG TPA: condensation domain-containing protein [Candidatus Acidoferrales bacterium]|nr:condensation domain-containing protein [Candidatus Acidoferrales bacterium]
MLEEKISTAVSDCPQIGHVGEPEYSFPATVAQKGFWFLDRIERGNPAWNIAVRFSIRGSLHIPTLERAINEIVRRHEVLRTTFSQIDGEPVQIVHSSASIPLRVDDLTAFDDAKRDVEEEKRAIEEGRYRFDLATGPLIRCRLLRLGPEEHMLLVTIHHIVSDGWSIGVFSDELGKIYESLYAGNGCALPDPPLQFADYAIWERERVQADLAERREYWKSKLAQLPLLEIPPDHPRPPMKTNNGYILSAVLPEPLTVALTELGHAHSCSLFAVSLAALNVLVRRYAGSDDIYVGTLLAGRDRVELEPLIGLFIKTVVLRTNLSGDPTFAELIDRVRKTADEAIAHAIEFQQVVEALQPKRDHSRPPLYGINFIYQRDFIKPTTFAGLTLTPIPSVSPGAIYDLNFFMVRRSDGWRLSCEYNSDLYEPETINHLISQMQEILQQAKENPNRRISELSFADRAGEVPSLIARECSEITMSTSLRRESVAGPRSAPAPQRPIRQHNGREYVGPRDKIEAELVRVWESVLGRDVDVLDDFFDLGGHSLLASRLLSGIQTRLGAELSLASLLDASTVERQAELIRKSGKRFAGAPARDNIVAAIPLFYLGGYPTFRPLTQRLSAQRQFHSLGMQESIVRDLEEPASLAAIAERFIQLVRERRPHGPYIFAGWCSHGSLALEMAQQLRAQGEDVPLVVLIEAHNPVPALAVPKWKTRIASVQFKWWLFGFESFYLRQVRRQEALDYIRGRVRAKMGRLSAKIRRIFDRDTPLPRKTPLEVLYAAADDYHPQPYPDPVLLMRGTQRGFGFSQNTLLGWEGLLKRLTLCEVPGNHYSMLGTGAERLSQEMNRYMQEADAAYWSARSQRAS